MKSYPEWKNEAKQSSVKVRKRKEKRKGEEEKKKEERDAHSLS